MNKINPNLATEARSVLEVNKSERHIRGGLATREKYTSAPSAPPKAAAQTPARRRR